MNTVCAVPLAENDVIRNLLSLKEAVVLADVSERRVRKDIETGLLGEPRIVRFSDARICFSWISVFTFAAVYSNAHLNARLRKIAIEKVETITTDRHFIAHSILHDCLDDSVWHSLSPVNIDKYISIDVDLAFNTVKPRLETYAKGLSRIEERPGVLGGEAVFKNSRLPVLHIGKMAENGEPVKDILADYAYLTEEDVAFARLYYRAHPVIGRPRLPEGASDDVPDAFR